jgi:transcriptional regulator GlxA family with amidase domain
MLESERHLSGLREQRETVPLLTSVCTGATVFAAAGLLRNRPATTNRHALDDLRRIDASIAIMPDERFVDDGDIITSAGISAGIDMALHIVGRLGGRSARRMCGRELNTTRDEDDRVARARQEGATRINLVESRPPELKITVREPEGRQSLKRRVPDFPEIAR